MNKCALLCMLLSILPASARMIAQDNEVYELKTKLEYAKDLAALHPDPGHILKQKDALNIKFIQLAKEAHDIGLSKFITKDLFDKDIDFRSFSGGFGSVPRGITTGLVKEREIANLEIYGKLRDELQKEFDDLENIQRRKQLHNFAQNNLEKVKEAYDKALMNYFEFEKDLS